MCIRDSMNVGTADFTRLAKNITKIGSVDSVAITNTATSQMCIRDRTTVISGDEHYTAVLSNDSKVVLAKFGK